MGADGKFRLMGRTKAGYKCSTQATLRYGWGLTAKAEKAALLAGTAFHKAADVHLTGGIDSVCGVRRGLQGLGASQRGGGR